MNKKKLKRREEKEENNKKKRSKSYTKKEKPKKLGRMVAPVHFDPKILPKGSAKLRWVGPEFGPEGKQFVSGNSYFWGMYKKQRSCHGRGARSAPFGMLVSPIWRVRAAHARARAAKTH
jgi:hypothetical protein